MLILLALQVVVPQVALPPERFSILAPPLAACRAPGPASDDIVVCGATDAPRLPLPAERGPPSRPLPSNMNLDGMGALAASAPVCAAQQAGCQVGVDVLGMGTAAVRLIQKLVKPSSCCEDPGEATNPWQLVGDVVGGAAPAGRKKPDKSQRVAIDLSDPPPPAKIAP